VLIESINVLIVFLLSLRHVELSQLPSTHFLLFFFLSFSHRQLFIPLNPELRPLLLLLISSVPVRSMLGDLDLSAFFNSLEHALPFFVLLAKQ